MAVLTVFPDAGNPGTHSCDGDIGTNDDTSWSDAQSNASCTDCSSAAVITTEASVGVISSVNHYSIIRTLMNFDTSGLGAGATIISATIAVHTESTHQDYLTNDYVRIVDNSIASNIAYALSDFNSIGSTRQADGPGGAGTDAMVETDIITSSIYVTWTLNSTGKGNINKSGVTHFGMRNGTDIGGVAPTPGTDPDFPNSGGTVVFWTSADAAGGTSTAPKLVITYTPADVYIPRRIPIHNPLLAQ